VARVGRGRGRALLRPPARRAGARRAHDPGRARVPPDRLRHGVDRERALRPARRDRQGGLRRARRPHDVLALRQQRAPSTALRPLHGAHLRRARAGHHQPELRGRVDHHRTHGPDPGRGAPCGGGRARPGVAREARRRRRRDRVREGLRSGARHRGRRPRERPGDGGPPPRRQRERPGRRSSRRPLPRLRPPPRRPLGGERPRLRRPGARGHRRHRPERRVALHDGRSRHGGTRGWAARR
jgi:hypothetical protein